MICLIEKATDYI